MEESRLGRTSLEIPWRDSALGLEESGTFMLPRLFPYSKLHILALRKFPLVGTSRNFREVFVWTSKELLKTPV